MATEVFLDTSGFFALMDQSDRAHNKASHWLTERRGRARPVTTGWVIGETCTLLVARKRPHLVARFLDHLEQSTALLVLNPDELLLKSTKQLIRRQAAQGYSFVDCLSFCVMKERAVSQALTTDQHFRKAGFTALLAD